MRRKFIAIVLAMLSFIGVSAIGVEKAGATTVLFTNYFGCDASSYHYRVTEIGLQESNGHQHKNVFLSIYHKFNGQLAHENAFYGDVPYHVYVASVFHSQPGPMCVFEFRPYPGFGFDMVQLMQTWQGGVGQEYRQGGYWNNRAQYNWSWIRYGDWSKLSPALEVYNTNGGYVHVYGKQ